MCLVILGVCLATYGDYYFTTWGFILTLFGTVLAALKSLATHQIQAASIVARPIKAHPRLYCLRTPFGAATISLAPLPRFHRHRLQLHSLDLLCSALSMLTSLERRTMCDSVPRGSSFSSLAMVSSLVLMGVFRSIFVINPVICAVWFFRLTIIPLNALGIAHTLLGGGWYSVFECNTKHGSLSDWTFGKVHLAPRSQ